MNDPADRLPTETERLFRALVREAVEDALDDRLGPAPVPEPIPLSHDEQVALAALRALRRMKIRPFDR